MQPEFDDDVTSILELAFERFQEHRVRSLSSWRGVDAVRRAAAKINAEAFGRAVAILLHAIRTLGHASSDEFAATATPEDEARIFLQAIAEAKDRHRSREPQATEANAKVARSAPL